ncbi:MAG: tRNA (adenosine(37)-N6)-threonylcarbamoyltransferase complex transferase subunit TsaD [Mycoplasmataceae bacterium]|nr:tRNA (adenosine(37)-N6)-threonylcarbamoyltransferase complex transferase subunit TsaD [Mycoplasmataceae bacterium]
MKILAIESSHDDTSISLYENKKIIKEITISQTEFHKKFGGTIPEYAARGHATNILGIYNDLASEFKIDDIDHIAYTKNPGLIGSLHVGRIFAYALGFALDKKVISVNHMHGHIFASAFDNEIVFPAIALIVSGGHTQLWKLTGYKPDEIEIIGQTKDDAVGEVFDKVARKLGIGFPGGPVIDKYANDGKEVLPFDIKDDGTYDMSFSGIKTKVINYISNEKQRGNDINIADVCSSFQDSIFKPLISKSKRAIEEFKPASFILGGGVSANSQLRRMVSEIHDNALIPSLKYTTDNASMIAIASELQLLDI